MTSLNKTWSLILAGAVLTAACGESNSSMTPVSPSAVVSGAQSIEAGASGGEVTTTGGPKPGNGNGNGGGGNGNGGGGNGSGNGGGGNGNGGGGNGNGNGNGQQPSVPPAQQPPTNTSPSTRRVEIEGLISAIGGDTITVNAMVVTVPPTCVIRHGSRQFQFSDLDVGDRVHVKALRTTTGTGSTAITTLEATEVKLQNPGGEDDDEEEATDLVSVTATDPLAAETGGNTGTFRLTRTGSPALLALPLLVTYTVSGTAASGTDYQSLSGTVTFLAGATTADVVVTPLADTTTEGAETVILTISTAAPYDLGAPATATIVIVE
jgi:hypothetical protein